VLVFHEGDKDTCAFVFHFQPRVDAWLIECIEEDDEVTVTFTFASTDNYVKLCTISCDAGTKLAEVGDALVNKFKDAVRGGSEDFDVTRTIKEIKARLGLL